MRLIKRLKFWHCYFGTYQALRRLSSHQLRDIGVERGNIEAIARQIAERMYTSSASHVAGQIGLRGREDTLVDPHLLWSHDTAAFHRAEDVRRVFSYDVHRAMSHSETTHASCFMSIATPDRTDVRWLGHPINKGVGQ